MKTRPTLWSKMSRRARRTARAKRTATFESLQPRTLMAGDLYGNLLDVEQSGADWGDSVQVEAQVRKDWYGWNSGFQVEFYLSEDTQASSDDLRLDLTNGATAINHAGFGFWPGVGSVQEVSLRLPSAKPVGWEGTDFYVLMKTDSAGQISETNETNNFGQQGHLKDRDSLKLRDYESYGNSFRDASHDDTTTRVFRDGALRFGYDLRSQDRWYNPIMTNTIHVDAIRNGTVVATWDADNRLNDSNELLNLNGKGLNEGWHQFRVSASRRFGGTVTGTTNWIYIQNGSRVTGDFTAETFEYGDMTGRGVIVNGQGGTDTLDLDISQTSVATLNGEALSQFSPEEGATSRQAILKGSTYDFLRLTNGREIYFSGIERLRFSDGSMVELTPQTNDPQFDNQWNLHTQDVVGAWRFTQGSDDVLLVTLDTGVMTPSNRNEDPTEDMTTARLVTDSTDDDNGTGQYGHGHKATSIMSSTPDNNFGIAGINWNSDVYVTDVYQGVDFDSAIEDAIDYAQSKGQRVVFQGGVQGEWWLTGGGGWTQQDLEDVISDHADMALFAVAAGNGDEDIDDTTPSNSSFSGGVARLAGSHGNVIAVGAASVYGPTESENNTELVSGLTNATEIDRRSYSNYGDSLTMMAATDVPAVDKTGSIDSRFGGTSAANPNMAGIASLVWSALPSAAASMVRGLLTSTAMDLEMFGRDDNTGAGLANAENAVRKAIAKARDPQLANLWQPFFALSLNTTAIASTSRLVSRFAPSEEMLPATEPVISVDLRHLEGASTAAEHDLALATLSASGNESELIDEPRGVAAELESIALQGEAPRASAAAAVDEVLLEEELESVLAELAAV